MLCRVLRLCEVGEAAAAATVAARLLAGGVAALPTDTIYGVAALAQNTAAVERIYAIKQRTAVKPLAICLADASDVLDWVAPSFSLDEALLEALLPGPVTLLLPRSPRLSPRLNPEARLVGVRVPDHEFVREVVRLCAAPLALTSANISGADSSLAVQEFDEIHALLDVVVDAGGLPGGSRLGSTVVDMSLPRRYRVVRAGSAETQTREILHRHGWEDAEASD